VPGTGELKTASNVVTRENGARLQLNMLNGVCRGMSRRRNGAATGARWVAKGAKHQNHRDEEEGGAGQTEPILGKEGQGKGGIRRKLTSMGPAPRGDRGAARLPRG
jgi:hypothetical protein